jgi:hypothetical protein
MEGLELGTGVRMSGEQEGGKARPPIGLLWMGAAGLLALLFYREFILSPERLLFGTDMLGEGYPLRQFLVEEVRAGRGVPGWTPHVFGGMPYVALLPGPVFYPTTLLYLLMPLYRAIGWTFVLHTFLAGAFGYFCGRSFRLGRAASAVCGASFMFTGYVMSHLYGGQDGRMFAMVLMPLALGALERGLRSGEARWFAWVGVTVGLQIFTPHTQLMYFSSLALALHLVFHLLLRAKRGGVSDSVEEATGTRRRTIGMSAYLRPIGLFAGAFLLAAGLGAVQLFPTVALLEHVVRAAAESGYEFAASWGLQPQEITALFLPDLIGSLDTYWGANPFKLHTEYLGVAPVALAVLAVATSFGSGGSRDRRRMIWYLGTAVLLGILFALGAATPVHRVAYAIVPMISGLRAPAMMMGPVAVFVSLLAGFGWDAAVRHRAAPEVVESGTPPALAPRLPLALLSAPFLFLGAAALINPGGLQEFVYHAWYPAGWPRTPSPSFEGPLRAGGAILLVSWAIALGGAWAVASRRVGQVAVVVILAVIVLDLWRVDSRYLRTADADAVLEPDAAMLALQDRIQPGQRVWALPGSFAPNDFMYFGISSATGSQKFLLRWYERLVGRLPADQGERLGGYPNTLWPLLDLRYLTAASDIDSPLLEPVAEEPAAEAGRVRLYAARSTQPHVFFPAQIEMVRDTGEALRRTLANEMPAEVAVVEVNGAGEPPPVAGAGEATIATYEPDEIVLRVRAERSGLLAVSEIYHPAWRAYVDGRETTVWRTNVAFRGVEVPEGEHEIRFVYHSASLRTGTAVSLISLLVALALLLPWSRLRSARGRVGA